MKTLVLTGSDRNMEEIHALTYPAKAAWANRHGYDFLNLRSWGQTPAVVWQKMAVVHYQLTTAAGYERVIWLDADSVITNPEWTVEQLAGDTSALFHISEDWGPCEPGDEWFWFNTGNFIASTGLGPDDKTFLDLWAAIWKRGRERWWDTWGFEQSTLQELKRNATYEESICVRPGKILNAVPRSVQPTTRHPWDASCFLAHITGITNPHRLEVVKGGFQ